MSDEMLTDLRHRLERVESKVDGIAAGVQQLVVMLGRLS